MALGDLEEIPDRMLVREGVVLKVKIAGSKPSASSEVGRGIYDPNAEKEENVKTRKKGEKTGPNFLKIKQHKTMPTLAPHDSSEAPHQK